MVKIFRQLERIEGAHSITASYGGSTDYNTSTSAALIQTVNRAASSTTLTSSINPPTLAATVTITVNVAAIAPGAGTPMGSVTLKDGATALGTVSLVSGKATFSTSSLAHGSHSMTAVYAGSADDYASTSPALTQNA